MNSKYIKILFILLFMILISSLSAVSASNITEFEDMDDFEIGKQAIETYDIKHVNQNEPIETSENSNVSKNLEQDNGNIVLENNSINGLIAVNGNSTKFSNFSNTDDLNLASSNSIPTKIVALNSNFVYSAGGAFIVELSTMEDEVLPYKSNVVFTINGVSYTRETDNGGYAYLNINLNPGTYQISYTFPSSSPFQSSSGSKTITVSKQNSVISYDNFKVNHKGESFNVNLTDVKGNPLAGKEVKFVINGVTYTRISDDKGIARLNINLNPGNYPISAYWNGDSFFNGNNPNINKNVQMLESSTKLSVNLKTSNEEFSKKGEVFKAILTENNNKPMVNQTIKFIINGVTYSRITDDEGIARLNINLNPNTYSIQTLFEGSSYYYSIQKYNTITVDYSPNFYYSVNIPTYINITGLKVSKSYSSLNVVKEGDNGVMKLPITRIIEVTVGSTSYSFSAGYGRSSVSGVNNVLNPGSSFFIYNDGNKVSVSSNFIPNSPGILLKGTTDYVQVYYYNILKEGEINHFSALFNKKQKSNIQYTYIDFIQNFTTVSTVSFSNPMAPYEDYPIKLQLNKGNQYFNGVHINNVGYQQFNAQNSLKYFINNQSLSFSQDYKTILIKPYNDLILTQLFANNKINERIEKIHYSLTDDILTFPYNYEVVQTYAITNSKVSNSEYNKYVSVSWADNYVVYGTFLNALSILWLSDLYADSLSGNFSVSWTRDNFVSSSAGYSTIRRIVEGSCSSCIYDDLYYNSVFDPIWVEMLQAIAIMLKDLDL